MHRKLVDIAIPSKKIEKYQGFEIKDDVGGESQSSLSGVVN